LRGGEDHEELNKKVRNGASKNKFGADFEEELVPHRRCYFLLLLFIMENR
jgi:hypothetical protein